MSVLDLLKDRIGASGPMYFDEFMEAALYGPGGFFAGDVLRSVKGGDFLTSPEVSPLFGSTLAAFVSRERERIGEPFRLVEVGAGSGSLLGPLLETVTVDFWAVEVSPPARTALQALLPVERVVDELAGAIGLDVAAFREALHAAGTATQLSDEMQQCERLRIDSFPALVLEAGPSSWHNPVDYNDCSPMLMLIDELLAAA